MQKEYIAEIQALIKIGLERTKFSDDDYYISLVYRYRDLIENGIFPYIVKYYNVRPTLRNYTLFKTECDLYLSNLSKESIALDRAIAATTVGDVWRDLSYSQRKNLEKEYLQKVRKYRKIWKIYSFVYVFYELHKDKILSDKIEVLQNERRWNLYFHRVFFEEEIVNTHSGIGSAILIYEKDSHEFLLVNDKLNGGYDYRGTALKTNENVLSLSLNRVTDSGDIDDKISLELKIYMNLDRSDEINLGAYLSYEKHVEIRVGTIVLQEISDGIPECRSRLLCPSHYRDEFLAIDSSIRTYLSKKALNRIKVKPKYRFIDLNSFLDLGKSRLQNKVPLFPVNKYRIYISTPVTGVEKLEHTLNSIDKIIENEIFKRHRQYIEFHIPANKGITKAELLDYSLIFTKIKESSLFVFFYPNDNTTSFSLIELGYAVGHCERIIIFCKDSSIPKQVGYFGKLKNVTVFNMKLSEEEFAIHIENELRLIVSNIKISN